MAMCWPSSSLTQIKWNKHNTKLKKSSESLLLFCSFRIYQDESAVEKKKPIVALQITAGHSSVANNGRSSANRPSFENIGRQKKLGNYKSDRPLFTHKKRILKLLNLKDLFFSNFVIQLYLNFFQNSDNQGTCIRHIRVWMLN